MKGEVIRKCLSIQKFFQKKYGQNTVVLVQMGKFYEIYEYDPKYISKSISEQFNENLSLKLSLISDKNNSSMQDINISDELNEDEPVGCAVEMSVILNMRLTSKDKEKPHSFNNPMLMGFPCQSYEDHRELILSKGYTIVRIDQKDKNTDDENVPREIAEISSPGTEIDNTAILFSTGANVIVSIYIECNKIKKNIENNVILCGISSIDISTGASIISEVYSKENDEIYAIQEIYRFLISQKPITVILNVKN